MSPTNGWRPELVLSSNLFSLWTNTLASFEQCNVFEFELSLVSGLLDSSAFGYSLVGASLAEI